MPWPLRYLMSCVNRGFTQWRIHQAVVSVIAVVGGFAFKDWFSAHPSVNIPLYLVAWLLAYTFVVTPALLWHQLQKIDDKDLEHLLYGFFVGNTFFYKAEITQLCKKYEGKSEIERLKNNLTEITVHAPRKSFASIKFEFMNSRQNTNNKCYFYFLNQKNKLTLIDDIYKDQKIFLDENSCFSFKLDYDDNYIINDEASLWITIDSWTK
jgi:hypothetical protein